MDAGRGGPGERQGRDDHRLNALAESPWGALHGGGHDPIAIFMGVYARHIRPGAIGEISVIGFVLLMLAIVFGQSVAESPTLGPAFTFTGTQLCWLLIGDGFIAPILPVWLLLAPRDYLSTFLKVGTIVALAIGIVVVAPQLRMPPLTRFNDGTGPVWSGPLFPFLFITIACGAVSGFHALIGHDAEAHRQRAQCPLHRLWRHPDEELRGDHGPSWPPA